MGDATTINLEAWERDFRINVTSMVLMSRYAIPEMRKQGRGSIVNMSSVSGCECPQSYLIKLWLDLPDRTSVWNSLEVTANLTHHTVLGGNPSLLYPTTKGAIIQMTRAMAAHHGPENIRVNCVAPGMVFTPMTRGRGMTDEMRQARINQNLMKKEGTGWDVGYGKLITMLLGFSEKEDFTKNIISAILFLASKEAGWITGLIMPVDGGVSTF